MFPSKVPEDSSVPPCLLLKRSKHSLLRMTSDNIVIQNFILQTEARETEDPRFIRAVLSADLPASACVRTGEWEELTLCSVLYKHVKAGD